MRGFSLPRMLIWWLPLGILLALTSLLVAAEHELQTEIEGALAMERAHVGRARTVREVSERAYIAMLERWIRNPNERVPRAKQVTQYLQSLHSATDAFASLEPLSSTEANARARLVVVLALFSNRVQKALINEDGPAAIEEIHEYISAINDATEQVLTVDSAAGQVSDTQMLSLRRKSSLAMAGLVILGASGCVLAFFWWYQKVWADRRYREAEAERRKQVEAVRLRTTFYAHLSHELRTPLVAIQNLAATLSDTSASSIAKRIRQAADELLHAINNVLDSSKLEAGRVNMTLETVDLGQVIRRSAHRCEGLVGDKDIEIAIEVADQLPTVSGDIVKLLQVVTNLVANAVKFTERGRVRVCAFQNDTRFIRLEVHDTGIGIAAEAIERIWQPFEQADPSVSSRFGGTGLGLSLVKSLVELHGGAVGVSSMPGVGTCFWVTLPIASAAAAA